MKTLLGQDDPNRLVNAALSMSRQRFNEENGSASYSDVKATLESLDAIKVELDAVAASAASLTGTARSYMLDMTRALAYYLPVLQGDGSEIPGRVYQVPSPPDENPCELEETGTSTAEFTNKEVITLRFEFRVPLRLLEDRRLTASAKVLWVLILLHLELSGGDDTASLRGLAARWGARPGRHTDRNISLRRLTQAPSTRPFRNKPLESKKRPHALLAQAKYAPRTTPADDSAR